ncbi:hypothetical protein CL622_02335 [archaeon]|nr:hypothetical protein [archaeon]|tara:strand:+ start:3052 stop:3729 length:678 start_codon:yes stop_codon:yes gene_type:complete
MVLVSIIMPCYNEEKTVGVCVKKAKKNLSSLHYSHEIIVVDNNCTDASAKIAKESGARVVQESVPGYGAACRAGFKAAKGKYMIMGDADDTYDFSKVSEFVDNLDNGYDFVIGKRIPQRGAMPWLHKYIGNPGLSWLTRLLFSTPVRDVHCGLRGIRRDKYNQLHFTTTGMEFATDMVIKSAHRKLKTNQIPIMYYRRAGDSKLHSFRDGYRHLRFMFSTFIKRK